MNENKYLDDKGRVWFQEFGGESSPIGYFEWKQVILPDEPEQPNDSRLPIYHSKIRCKS